MSDKRPDELDDYRVRISDEQSEFAMSSDEEFGKAERRPKTDKSTDEEVQIASGKTKILEVITSVFCGFESIGDESDDKDEKSRADMERQRQSESRRRIESFYSLNQTYAERLILNINLIFILAIAIGLFVFFSIPPEFHILSHLKNATMSSTTTTTLNPQ